MWPHSLRPSLPLLRTAVAAAPVGRRLWTAAASTDPSLDAAASACVDAVRAAVARTRPPPDAAAAAAAAAEGPAQDACLVLVTQAYSGVAIARLGGELGRRLRGAGLRAHVSGTVVDQILDGRGRPSSRGLAVLYHHSAAGAAQVRAQPFYVGDQHGRQRLREVAVGRWHNSVTDRFESHRALDHWVCGQSSVTRAPSHVELPPELSAGDPEAVRLLVFSADRESRQVLDALDARFPRAAKLGIVGSRTPFLNGQEHTMLADAQVHDGGVLGFAFAAQHDCVAGPLRVRCGGLEPVTRALRIERCRGNVVLELEDGDSAHSLIAALRRRQRPADDDDGGGDGQLYARIMRTRGEHGPLVDPGSAVLRVTGGSPAKGGLALDTLRDLAPGHYIQFLVAVAGCGPAQWPGSAPEIRFGACGSSEQPAPAPEPSGPGAAALVFGGATEGGFAYGWPQPRGAPAQTGDDGSVFSGSRI
ncbi:hypothetical protein H4R18_004466 [Coemansia javaensis]|uniref:FIST domain-containing protein n=1 Tax=Coemansia javaensis TaxID=2761396 RepID=A0A9W8LGU9_9FUNG|nr:hypothetical protein H4R18_004466 [Coemansia javaensis]